MGQRDDCMTLAGSHILIMALFLSVMGSKVIMVSAIN